MQHRLIVDFTDWPDASTSRQLVALEQLGVLCGMNRRSGKRIVKTVSLILNCFPPEWVKENAARFVATDQGWSLELLVSTLPVDKPISDLDRTLGSLLRSGEKLQSFEISGSLREGFQFCIEHPLGLDFEIPRARELRQWARIIRKGDWQSAFAGLSKIYLSNRLRIQQLRDGITVRRQVLDSDQTQQDVIFSLVASKTNNPVLILDAAGQIEWTNQAFHQLTGIDFQDGIKRNAADILFVPGEQPNTSTAFFDLMNEGLGFSIEYAWKFEGQNTAELLTDRESWIEFQVTPVRDEHDVLARWIAIGADVTQRRQAEIAMQHAKNVAEAASQAKSDFLAMMSHEIRTPMNAILGMTELALGTPLSSEQKQYLQTTNKSAQSLLQILNDVLDLAKVEAQQLRLEQTRLDVMELTSETLETLSVLAGRKQLQLHSRFEDRIPHDLVGDPGRLRQILVNLVGNAIKFTREGEVRVEVAVVEQDKLQATIQFSVCDTGVGIPQDKLGRIFDAFYQSDTAANRDFGGTGLGLAITSELVRLMDGRIWVESRLGKGSKFHFVITLPKASSDVLVPEPDLSFVTQASLQDDHRISRTTQPLSVLVVDDHESNLQLLKEILRRRGHNSRLASSGQQALELLASETLDVVLMDVQMPGMDGLETTRRLRDSGRNVPVIALTAYVTEDDRNRCLEAGMSDYLAKPVNIVEVLEKLESWGGIHSPETASALEPASHCHEFADSLNRFGGDLDLLKMQMGYFLDETPQLLARIKSGLQQRDSQETSVAAHRLKGLLLSYDEKDGADQAALLESPSNVNEAGDTDPIVQALSLSISTLADRIHRFLDR